MNGTNILEIAVPELLFSKGDAFTINQEYKDLAKKYHPDISNDPDASNIFAHIGKLHKEAVERVERGVWEIPGQFIFKDVAGKEFRIKYNYRMPFELGRMYCGENTLIYFIDKQYHDLYVNAKNRIKNLKFASAKMKDEFSRYLPNIKYEGMTEDAYILALEKTPDVVPLRGLQITHIEGLDPKHVAWVLSSMHNMLCYLEWANLAHVGINLDTYFVSYEHHTGLLLGGWWYTTPYTQKIKYAPKYTVGLLNKSVLANKKAVVQIDTELIKSVGRELMGKYMSKKNYPELTPMIDWLLMTTRQCAKAQFKSWDEVLTKTFGKRRFVKLDTSIEEVYNNLN